jgi:1,2-diacylglycerol 3-alpha-glucosyltransferase
MRAMTRRVVLVTEIISPYRIPLFNALARRPGIDLHVIFLSETDPSLRQWEIYKNEIKFSYQVLPCWRRRIGKYNLLINRKMTSALKAAAAEVIVCGGYSYLASWQCLLWSRRHQIPLLLWSESNEQDARRRKRMVEFLKKNFLRRCTSFIVPGQSARAYLRAHGVDDENIFTAPNAVDNDLFAAAAERTRTCAEELRDELALPERYFLFVGRMVVEKGVFDLLEAYAKLDGRLREQIGLVFAGNGPARQAVEERAARISPGTIRFPGFVQRDDLAKYYGLAEALVLATHSDTWGLVVNEAMACGLAIILTDVAGCAPDLIQAGWNGFLIAPKDISSLAAAMASLAVKPDLCKSMGLNSQQQVAPFTAEVWANSIHSAIKSVRREHD